LGLIPRQPAAALFTSSRFEKEQRAADLNQKAALQLRLSYQKQPIFIKSK
jgi:hypothetical protein